MSLRKSSSRTSEMCINFVKEIKVSRWRKCTQIGKNEEGAVLVITIMILAVLIVLGVAALNTTDTEIRISANDKVYKQAFYSAEAGVSYGLESGFALFPPVANGPPYKNVATPADLMATSPGTTLEYIDYGGSPRRVEIRSTGNVPGGGVAVVIAGIVSVTTGAQSGAGIGEEYH